VHVIFVTEADITKPVETELHRATGLTEQIIYFKKEKGLLSRLRKQWRWKNIFQDAVKQYVATQGKPDLVHVHIPWKAGLVALWMKKKFETSFIISEHWGVYDTSDQQYLGSKPKLTQKIYKEIYKAAMMVVSVSRFLALGIERKMERKVDHIIPNVVDTSLFFYREEKYSKFTFIHVSNMVALKNVGPILEAFHQCLQTTSRKDLQLVMIGNRDDEYPKLAREMGLLNSSVFFRGEISYTDVAEEMQRSHAFVLFSDSETFSCVTAEALCCGLPVIAASRGALPELVDQSRGYLVSTLTKKSLADAMQRVLDAYDFFDRKRISEDASAKYGYCAVSEAFCQLYDAAKAESEARKSSQNQQGLNKIPASAFQNPPC